MNEKQVIRLVGALGGLVLIWGALALMRRAPDDRGPTFAIAKVDTAAVDSLVITTISDTSVVARDPASSGRWRTNGHPADSSMVQLLLGAVATAVNPAELVAESRASHAKLGVNDDSARRVRVFADGRTQVDVVVGKRTPEYGGVYARSASDSLVYALRGPLGEPLAHPMDDWRDKRMAGAAPESVAVIEVRKGSRGYALQRAGGSWRFASGRTADSGRVADLLNALKTVSAAGFPRRGQSDSLDFRTPIARVRLRAKSSRLLMDLEFDSTAAGIWARPVPAVRPIARDRSNAFRIESWTLATLTPAESTLYRKK